jgi:hypothetical protein
MIKAMPTLEGAGAYLRRAFGCGNPKEFDPVLLPDDLPSSTASIVGNLPASKH